MYSKLSLAFVAALAVVVQADDLYKNGTFTFPSGSGAPLSTGAPTATGTGASSSSPSSVGESGDTTLIYTLGTGSSTTVITTTIHHTIYQTESSVSFIIGQTILLRADLVTQFVSATSDVGAEAASRGKSTRYRTIQSTIYVPAASATGSGGESAATGGSAGNGAAGNGASGCGGTVTVTATGPVVTVTVVSASHHLIQVPQTDNVPDCWPRLWLKPQPCLYWRVP